MKASKAKGSDEEVAEAGEEALGRAKIRVGPPDPSLILYTMA